MNHLSEEQLLDAYYGDGGGEAGAHLAGCGDCRASFARLKEELDSVREYAVPERGDEYGAAVWARLAPRLPAAKPRRRLWLQWWTLAPAFAALLAVTFTAGRLTERRTHPAAISEKARERVLLLSLSDHLERSQVVLANVANATTDSSDLLDERLRARELVGANRLLRQTAARLGDMTDAALLDELERVLLDVANGPDSVSAAELENLQERIDRDGLLFRVRITTTDSRARGEKL